MAEDLGGDGISLQELFTRGRGIQRRLENDEISPTSEEGKKSMQEGVKCLEQATHLVNQLSLFSKNEGLEDVTTANLKFLLLPALLGDLTMQSMSDDRLDNIQKARVYFVDYLQRSTSYAITSEDVPSGKGVASAAEAPSPRANYEKLAAERTAKIQRYKEQKELERKLKELSVRLESSEASPDHQGDDEVSREHFITLLKLWVMRCRDHISSIDQEVPLLREMERRRKEGGRSLQSEASAKESPPPKVKPWKPIVITREMLQSQVYGAGYPSLPTMSVEEFYDQKYKEQMESKAQAGLDVEHKMRDMSMVGANQEEEDGGHDREEEEKEEDEDSEEALKKAREFDDFKDDNKRGWGNKKNMG